MPIYVYETTDKKPARRFEAQQSMKDEPLRADPETGRPVRRVITGGYGVLQKAGASRATSQGCGTGGCGCH